MRSNRSIRFLISTTLGAFLLGGCASLLTQDATVDPSEAKPGAYTLDPTHTSVIFAVRHMGLADYYGRFDTVSGSLDFDPDNPTASRVLVDIDTASVNTNSDALEKMLRSASMFDTGKHPTATFTSTGIDQSGAAIGQVTGELTMAGATAPLTLEATFNGSVNDLLRGAYVVGFSAKGKFNRSTFGMTQWDFAVGDEISLIIEAEFVKSDD
jgi:polyisoprenoid-binding protein YceI